MNEDKELEEAKNNLKKIVELRKNKRREIRFDTCICGTKDLEIILQELENSIPKKKIEDELEITVEEYNKSIAKFDFKECQNLSSSLYESIKLEIKKQILQELLEDKQICK